LGQGATAEKAEWHTTRKQATQSRTKAIHTADSKAD
jgi:hypothetical protein